MIAAATDKNAVTGGRDRPRGSLAPYRTVAHATRFACVALATVAVTSRATAQERKLLTDVPFICVEARIEPGILPGPYSADELRDVVTMWLSTRISRHMQLAGRQLYEPKFGLSIVMPMWGRPECKMLVTTKIFVSYSRLRNGAPFRVEVDVYHHVRHTASESEKDITGLPGAINKNNFYIGQDINKQADFIWSKIK